MWALKCTGICLQKIMRTAAKEALLKLSYKRMACANDGFGGQSWAVALMSTVFAGV